MDNLSNIGKEMLLVLWCDTDGNDEKVHSRMRFETWSVTSTGLHI